MRFDHSITHLLVCVLLFILLWPFYHGILVTIVLHSG